MFGKWLAGLLSVCDFWRLTYKHAKTLKLSIKETEIILSEGLKHIVHLLAYASCDLFTYIYKSAH